MRRFRHALGQAVAADCCTAALLRHRGAAGGCGELAIGGSLCDAWHSSQHAIQFTALQSIDDTCMSIECVAIEVGTSLVACFFAFVFFLLVTTFFFFFVGCDGFDISMSRL